VSAKRTERLLNLTICLLATRRYLTKDQIRKAVPGYAECATDDAFERMFERDKEELRDLGIPLDTGMLDALHGDDQGYRIDRDAYALPDVSFAPDELAVLGLAARAWQQASLSTAAGTALLKLKAAGADPDSSGLLGLEPRLSAGEPAFAALWAAVRDRRAVRFDYRAGREVTVATRRVEPWGLLTRNGAWYLVGFDRDRCAPRVFRVSRITGDVRGEGATGAVVVPPGTDIRDQLARMVPPEPRTTARLKVRDGAGLGLRRTATVVQPAEPGWDHVELGYFDIDRMAADVTAYGAAVVVEGPDELRTAVIERLRALAGVRR
jgi:proteasome accessory factor B